RDQSVRSSGIHPHEHTALPARRDRHVPVDQEREAAEHLPLGARARPREQLTNAIRELLVVRHGYGCVTSGSGCRKRFAAFRCVIRRSSSSGTWPQCSSITRWVSGQVLSPWG